MRAASRPLPRSLEKDARGAQASDVRNTPCIRWLATLALIFNVLGSPMAWAHAFGAHEQADVPASQMTPACHGAAAGEPSSVPDLPPCCDGGGCHCAAPALSIFAVVAAGRAPHPPFSAPFESAAQPAHPLDDTLRPPIR